MNFSSAQKNLLACAQEAFSLGKKETALLFAQTLLRSAPSYLEALQLARTAAQALDASQKQHRKRVLLKKTNGFFLLVKAKIALLKKKHLTALIVLEKLIELLPNWFVAHRWMAQTALEHQPPFYDLALFCFEDAIKLAPNKVTIHLELARAIILAKPPAKRNPARALQAYHAVLAMNPTHLEAQAGMKNALALMALQEEVEVKS